MEQKYIVGGRGTEVNIGWTEDHGSCIMGYCMHPYGYVGNYHRDSNTTLDARGNVYSRGNAIESLIRESYEGD